MSDKWDEVEQLAVALDALKTQPFEAQLRMLDYLRARLVSDYQKAMAERETDARERVKRRAAKP